MTTLYLLRHGETEENRRHILQGTTPGHLTELGRAQAAQAAQGLRGVHFDALLSSDLRRCLDTSAIVAAALRRYGPGGNALHITPTRLLRERDWGSATGMVADGTARIAVPPDAESVEAMRARARVFLDFAAATYRGQTLLVVSHGLFLRCLQAVCRGVEMADIARMENAEVRVLPL